MPGGQPGACRRQQLRIVRIEHLYNARIDLRGYPRQSDEFRLVGELEAVRVLEPGEELEQHQSLVVCQRQTDRFFAQPDNR